MENCILKVGGGFEGGKSSVECLSVVVEVVLVVIVMVVIEMI